MEVKLPEDVAEGFRKEFCPLLNEGGSRKERGFDLLRE
jgi:hypothetical protein